MAQDALKKAYEAQRKSAKTSRDTQVQIADVGLENTSDKYERGYQEAIIQIDAQQESAEQRAEKVAQEAYIQKMQQQRVAPNLLRASGLSSQGYSESTLGKISTQYQKAWSDIINERERAISELDRDRGSAQRQRDYGIADAESQYQQAVLGIEGEYQTNLYNLDAGYQRDLASYLASLGGGSGGSGGGSNATLPSGDINSANANRTSPAEVERGLKNIPFDPRTGNYSQLEAYLMQYVNAGVIDATQAQSMLNKLLGNYQPTSQTRPGVETQPGKNVADYNNKFNNNKQTTTTKKSTGGRGTANISFMR